MITTILQGVLACTLVSFACVVWRRYFAANPLDNIPGPPSQSWWTGNLKQLFDPYGWSFHQLLDDRFGSLIRTRGLFGARWLIISDPKALHYIVVKDQYTWEETDGLITTNQLAFGNGLISTVGERHRKQRKMLNPVFSVSHLRHMVPIFQEVSTTLRDTIAAQVKDGPRDIDMLEWFTRTALELIGQSGLGHSFDSLKGATANPYTLVRLTVPSQLLPYVVKIGSPKFRRYIAEIVPWKELHEVLRMVDIMDKTSIDIFEAKKKALRMGDEACIAAGREGTLVFVATDTTSGALSRTLLTLAQHPEAQDRLREEIKQAKADKGNLSYDDLVNLPYLDAVCRETLRLYPPATFSLRTARKDILLPFSTPIKGVNGAEMRDIVVPKDTNIFISIVAANHNREIWGEDALEWKPDRWLKPLPSSVTEAHIPGIYSHLMTFLGGGRACIGFKFSQLEMKVVLSVLLESFRFKPCHEIVWTMGLSAPRIKDSKDETYQLPLNVEAVLYWDYGYIYPLSVYLTPWTFPTPINQSVATTLTLEIIAFDLPTPVVDLSPLLAGMSRIAVAEDELRTALLAIRKENPTLGVVKLHILLLKTYPTWAVSEKRVRKILQSEGLVATEKENGSAYNGATLVIHPTSRLNESLDVKKWSSKVEVHYFNAAKGKGLVATEKISEGEIVWREDPFVLAPEWWVFLGTTSSSNALNTIVFFREYREIYDLQQLSTACAFCSTPLGDHSPLHLPCVASTSASPCPAMFCNRLLPHAVRESPSLCSVLPAIQRLFPYLKFARKAAVAGVACAVPCTASLSWEWKKDFEHYGTKALNLTETAGEMLMNSTFKPSVNQNQ
ncbi:cytochrome P450 [Melanogaster broomeanus]|nr:cytochrome P450 [Melanogaster broomeanus]